MSEHLTPVVKRRLRPQDPNSFYEDDLEWLETAAADDPIADCLDQLLAERLNGYRVRVFHACRPRDIESYYLHGLRYLRPEDAVLQLRVLVDRYDELVLLRDEARLNAALRQIESNHRGGWLYVGLDDRDLLKGAGHYLIYGSEYLYGILAYCGISCQQALTREGIPTVFVLDAPVSLFSKSDMLQFARQLLAQWARNIAHRHCSAPEVDFTFALQCDIPPACIAGHYHPPRISDPLNYSVPHLNPRRSCPRPRCSPSPRPPTGLLPG
jgi:hypothetical protein